MHPRLHWPLVGFLGLRVGQFLLGCLEGRYGPWNLFLFFLVELVSHASELVLDPMPRIRGQVHPLVQPLPCCKTWRLYLACCVAMIRQSCVATIQQDMEALCESLGRCRVTAPDAPVG